MSTSYKQLDGDLGHNEYDAITKTLRRKRQKACVAFTAIFILFLIGVSIYQITKDDSSAPSTTTSINVTTLSPSLSPTIANVTIATLSPTLSNEYDEASALTALYYSFGSYCNANVLQTWNCVPWCQSLPDFSVHTVVVDTAHKLQAFTGYDAKTKQVIISFRGTNNNHNKLLDTNWAQIYFNQNDRDMEHNVGEGDWAIHLGFYRGLRSLLHGGLLDSLWQIFDEHNEANVLLTGHSLGGALAQILALMFVVSPLVNDVPIGHVDIITFGSPRWGSKDIVTYFNTLAHNNWRVVNKYDMVPTLPWITEGDYGYYQPETEVLYTEFGTLEYRMCGSGEKGDDCVFNAAWDLKYHLTYLNVPNNDASCL